MMGRKGVLMVAAFDLRPDPWTGALCTILFWKGVTNSPASTIPLSTKIAIQDGINGLDR